MKPHHKTHYRRLHLRRISWFAFLFVSLFAIQLIYNVQMTRAGGVGSATGVLAYATSMSVGDLLTYTNQHRAANGLGPLALNGKLNSAGQNKAQHMIDNNYWAHVAPDGTTPWYWFDLVGYDYINAGENLAYGFLTSASTVQAWMDSPGHRANILGDYKDVGFGYVNGASYQGGQYTVIVAHYGTTSAPQSPTPVPAPPPAPAAAPKPKPAVAPPAPVAPTPPPAPVEQPKEEPKDEDSPTVPVTTNESPPPPSQNAPDSGNRVMSVQAALTGKAAWPFYASMAAVAVSVIGFVSTHLQLLSYAWQRGMRFASLHPMFDAAVVGAVTLFLMTATVGFIK